MARSFRPFLLALALIATCAFLAGAFAPENAAAAATEEDINAGLKQFTSIYRLAEENSAEKVDPDKAIFKGAVPGMLRTLDPHSSFFDVKDFANLREEQRGLYYGVGMTVQPKDGRTVVVAPFTGSPAYKAGIRPGDVILEVNDKRTDGLNTTQVADLLKGPKGTPVQIVIAREGVEKPIIFNVIRGEIPRHSVETAFFIKPGIVYLDIQSFTETTSKEVEENLKKLGEQNVKGLILDLRENPGGLLNEGVAVAGRFLKRGQTVVSHRGRSSPEKPYSATNGSATRDYPIVVIVNRYSASAAEIVAGALQDHDRAWIIGDNTFGKGLVQTVFPLSDNTGLALTTAKYYTPSGRLIQRDYSNGSFYDYYFRKDIETKNMMDAKMTDGGRTVYGGAGISPDEKVSFTYNKYQIDLLRRRAFFDFITKWFGSHETTVAKTWSPDQVMMNDFHEFLLKSGIQFTEGEFAENNDWMRNELKKEAFITSFSRDEALKFAAEADPMVQKAIEALPRAKNLLETSKKQIVQRDVRSPRN
jgi:carboxyl-terminal processing protease